MAIVPTLTAIQALAPAAGRLAGATQLFGPEQREALAELEEPGLRRRTEESLQGFRQDMFRPILQSQQEQQQGLAQALTPAAAGGALGATARGFQGAAQRMERATEGPMLKVAEQRRKAEIKEEEDEAKLQAMKRERRQAVLMETFNVLGAAAKGAEAFEEFAGLLRSDKEEQARLIKAYRLSGKEDYTGQEAQSAARIAGVGDQFQAHTVQWKEGRGPAAASITGSQLGAMGAGAQTQVEMNAALQVLGAGNIPTEEAAAPTAPPPSAPPPSRYALEGVAVAPGSAQAFVKDAETGDVISVDEAYRRVQESRTGGRRRVR